MDDETTSEDKKNKSRLNLILFIVAIAVPIILFSFIFYYYSTNITQGRVNDTQEVTDTPEKPKNIKEQLKQEGQDVEEPEEEEPEYTEKCGELNSDETWSGEIRISCVVEVPKGVTLTIEPGTVVKFKHDRNYKTYDKGALYVEEGTIKAEGTANKMIWFTSDAPDPINGDWQYIKVENSDDSVFDYVIIEFGEMGILQLNSEVNVSNSIIRWCNSEGLYAERSNLTYQYNLLYGNGYHEIALEQYNDAIIMNNIFRDGRYGIHNEETTVYIEGNYFANYNYAPISGGMDSELKVIRNKFENITSNNFISAYGGTSVVRKENDYGNGNLSIPNLNLKDIRNFEIDYIPGDTIDKFRYIYNKRDETRNVINKLGEDLSFGWTLEYFNKNLYRFSQDPSETGTLAGFIEINPKTDSYKRYHSKEIINPRGLTWDGEYFYVNDFSLLKVYKFKTIGNLIEIYESYDIPDKEKGGTMGLTSDDKYLYMISRDKSKIYRLNKSENLSVEEEITFDSDMDLGNAIVWTGEHFWTAGGCKKGICKWDENGTLVGEIYPVAKDTWALAWDGQYLWSLQRTCELWNDAKIYQIEIINDSLSNQSTSA